jgi:hypothetical protein
MTVIHESRPTPVGNVFSLRTGCGRRSRSLRSVRMQAVDQGIRAFVELVVSRFQLTLKRRYSTTICRAGGCGVEDDA